MKIRIKRIIYDGISIVVLLALVIYNCHIISKIMHSMLLVIPMGLFATAIQLAILLGIFRFFNWLQGD